jgi:hypothetical protein
MQSLLIMWRLLFLASIVVFPQLLGILLYFRLSRAPRWVAAIVAAVAPAVVFFWLDRIFLMVALREVYARGERCGMPAFGAILILFTGTAIQLVLGIITQAVLAASRRHKVPSVSSKAI